MKASFRKFFRPVILPIALQLMLIAPAMAQGTRTIRVSVTDDKDQPVADARIQILGIDVGSNWTKLKTNAKGECSQFLGTQPGTYRVVARKDGFQPAFKDKVSPEMDETVEVALKLISGKDFILPWEMTDKQRAELKKMASQQKQNAKGSSNLKAIFEKGVQLAKEEKYDDAIIEFTKAIEMDPKQTISFSNRADAYTKLKKYDEALADCDKAISIAAESKKEDPNLYFQKAVALSLSGKIDEADKIFQTAAEKAKGMSPVDAARFHLNRGIALNNNGIGDKAIEAFRQAIALDSKCEEAYYQLGVALSAKPETFSEALEALKKYLKLGSNRKDHLKVAEEMIAALGKK
jgi:tetratricopeptide (TPR) repeat protein